MKFTEPIHPADFVRTLCIAAIMITQLTGPAQAELMSKDDTKVLINAVKGAELKSYRIMVAGLDAFDVNHALAPQASEVRFRIRPLIDDQAVDMNKLALRIAGNTFSAPLALAEDHTFSLPRLEGALAEDADLVLNKKRSDYRWDALVNSTGVPTGKRRLGDRRLACQVIVAIEKNQLTLFQRGFAATIFGGADWCRTPNFQYSSVSTRRLPVRS